MANYDRGNYPPRQTVQGNWKCTACGKEITELPFEPVQGRDLFCKECWRTKRDDRNDRFRR